MRKFDIAPAQHPDLGEIVALVNSAYRGDSSRAGWTTEADLLDGQRVDLGMLRDALDAGEVILCLREGAGRPILACVTLKPDGDRVSPDVWYLGMLTVAPGLQGGGIGKALLASAENFARERGARRMWMSVIQVRSELIAWYERRGYRKTGETGPFPYGNARFGVPRRPDLSFVFLEKELT